MSEFRRFLLVSDHNGHLKEGNREFDIVSWDNLKSLANAADYDGWLLSVTALTERVPRKIFLDDELRVLFVQRTMLHILTSGGNIYVVGDYKNAFFVPASTGANKHLDAVVGFSYSLRVKKSGGPLTIVELGTTNFGTCLGLHARVGSGGYLIFLPSMGTTLEVETKWILKEIFGFALGAAAPSWAAALRVPGQGSIETTLQQKQNLLKKLTDELVASRKELQSIQRWKRLLYDDGFGLEEIVKEAFEVLGAKVVKTAPEKDDLRLSIPGHAPCVLEVKGTRKARYYSARILSSIRGERPNRIEVAFIQFSSWRVCSTVSTLLAIVAKMRLR